MSRTPFFNGATIFFPENIFRKVHGISNFLLRIPIVDDDTVSVFKVSK